MNTDMILGLPNEEYHARPEWSSTLLKRVYEESVWHALNNDVADSEALRVGAYTHAILEGDFSTYVAPDYSRTVSTVAEIKGALDEVEHQYKKSGTKKELIEELRASKSPLQHEWDARRILQSTGAIVVDSGEWAKAEKLALAAMLKMDQVPLTSTMSLWEGIRRHGIPEPSVITELQELPIRVRPDALIRVGRKVIIVSYKTAREGYASPRRYRYVYRRRLYDLADAFYWDALEAAGYQVHSLINVVIEKPDAGPSPHAVAIYTFGADNEQLEYGREKYIEAIEEIKTWERGGNAGYPCTGMEI